MGRKVRQATPYAAEGKWLKAARLALAAAPGNERYKVLEHYARDADIPSNHYSQHETGVRRITLERARALKAKFGLTLDFIYDGELANLKHAVATRIQEELQTL